MSKLPIVMVTDIVVIKVAFTRNGTAAHALHTNCKTTLGPWLKFPSAHVLERAWSRQRGQLEDHRDTIRRWGQGTSNLTPDPRRENLLRIDWDKL
jgi:hypothetical protein